MLDGSAVDAGWILCRFVVDLRSILCRVRVDWASIWGRCAEVLSRALPRGGRVGPQMLDALRPVEPEASEAAVRRLVAVLGADEGLRGCGRARVGL